MRFFLDHDVRVEVARVLRHEGYEVTELREVLAVRASDVEVFNYACEHGLMLITCNRDDFLSLAAKQSNSGIIILVSSPESAKGAEGAPDLVVEILSPKTAHLDLEQKRLVYARTGVDELWVVDPEGEEVRVYLFREDPNLPKVILRSGDLLKTSRLSGFELSIQKIFKRF